MPVRPTFPGVYIEEIPSGVRPVTAVATSTAAFIGTFRKGPDRRSGATAQHCRFRARVWRTRSAERGVLRGASILPQRRHGSLGCSNRTTRSAGCARNCCDDGCWRYAPRCQPQLACWTSLQGGAFAAPRPAIRETGADFLRLEVEHNGTAATSTFNLFVSEVAISGTRTTVLQTESFRNLSMTPDTANNAFEVVNQGSRLIQFAAPLSTNLPVASGTVSGDIQDPIAGGATEPRCDSFRSAPQLRMYDQYCDHCRHEFRRNGPPISRLPCAGAGVDPSVLPEHRAYFTGSTVDLLGDGSAANPRRFAIRARPWRPAFRSGGAVRIFGRRSGALRPRCR